MEKGREEKTKFSKILPNNQIGLRSLCKYLFWVALDTGMLFLQITLFLKKLSTESAGILHY